MSLYNKRISRLILNNNNNNSLGDWNKVFPDAYSVEKRSMTNSTPDSSSGIVSDDHCHTILSDSISASPSNVFNANQIVANRKKTDFIITSEKNQRKCKEINEVDSISKQIIFKSRRSFTEEEYSTKNNRNDCKVSIHGCNPSQNETSDFHPRSKSASRHQRLTMTPSPSGCQTFSTLNDNINSNCQASFSNSPQKNTCYTNQSFTPHSYRNVKRIETGEVLKSDKTDILTKPETFVFSQKPPTFKKPSSKCILHQLQLTTEKSAVYQNISDFLECNATNNDGKQSQTSSEIESANKNCIKAQSTPQQNMHPTTLPQNQRKVRKKITFSPETKKISNEKSTSNSFIFNEQVINEQNRKQKSVYSFNHLEDHLITNIFKYLHSNELCKCAMVCKRWYQLVWSPVLWSDICVQNSKLDIDKGLKCMIIALSCEISKVCLIIESINLTGSSKLTDKGLNVIANRCTELKKLVVDGCTEITNIAIYDIVSKCINLQFLSMSGCQYVTSVSLTPEANLQATSCNKQIYLNHLDMTDCINVDDFSLQMIVTYCSELSYLYLRRCIKITDLGVQYAASYCNKLKELSVSDCPNISDFGMKDISKLESNLKYLSVAKCRRISDVGLKYVAQKCSKLRYLNIRACDRITENGLIFLAVHCSKLRSLDLGNCNLAVTDRSISTLADNCKQLKRLSLKGCVNLSENGLIEFASKSRQLQQINLIDCKVSFPSYNALHEFCDDCIVEHNNPGVAFNK